MKPTSKNFRSLFVVSLFGVLLVTGWTRVRAVVSPSSTQVTTPVSAQQPKQPTEKIIAQLEGFEELVNSGFAPQTDGYSFENYRDEKNESSNEVLDSSHLTTLFGRDNKDVCETPPDEDGYCVLTAPAERWLTKQIDTLKNGRCEGMAVSSLALWMHQKGWLNFMSPSGLTEGKAQTVSQLEQNDFLTQYIIAFFHVMQGLKSSQGDGVADWSRRTREMKPSEILRQLIEKLQQKEPVTLGIYENKSGHLTDGHTLAPFAVAKKSDGTYRISVYDSNHTGETRSLTIDPQNETWRYETVLPNGTTNAYQGNADSHNLDLVPVTARFKDFACPFCGTANASGSSLVEFSLIGEGAMTIARLTDVKNNQFSTIGFNPEQQKYFNEIEGAEIEPFKGGLGDDVSPTYLLPGFDQITYNSGIPNQFYVVDVYGRYLGETGVEADLMMAGNNFVVGIEDLALASSENMRLAFAPDGKLIDLKSSQDSKSGDIVFAIDNPQSGESYIFTVGDVDLKAGSEIALQLNMNDLSLTYYNKDNESDTFQVTFVRVQADGTEDRFVTESIPIEPGQYGRLGFREWVGGNQIAYKVDKDKNGTFEDAEPIRGKPSTNVKPGKKPKSP